jgi:AraC-like DNA-binding protein
LQISVPCAIVSNVDELTSVLDGPRAQGAFVVRSVLAPPWAIRVQDEAPMTIVAVVRGVAWIRFDDGETAVARAGDVAILRGDEPYEAADSPSTPASVIIHPDNSCTTLDGVELKDTMTLGVRTWGTGDHPDATVMLTGAYQFAGDIDRRLLSALPRRIHLPAELVASPIVDLLGHELDKDQPGQQAVLDRLLDLLLISSLRTWFDGAGDDAPHWYRAHRDPLVGPALRLVQHRPAEPWTVASLAAAVGSSRAVFARRFNELVGQPPMQYLTEWRLSLAADALRDPGVGLAAVASQVGYSTPFALSNAFKRVRGVSPTEFRRRTA